MTTEQNNNNAAENKEQRQQEAQEKTTYAVRPHHHYKRQDYSDPTNLKARNKLNTAFILLVIVGITPLFAFQVFANVAEVTNLFPVTGISLPFFSYGGSSLWGFTILLFIFLSIDAKRNMLKA